MVLTEKCDVVACESTSDFWVPIYDSLISHLTVIVGNARDMKAFTHKKTDKIDSEFIAQLALNNMIKPSRVFSKNQREFRSYIVSSSNFVGKSKFHIFTENLIILLSIKNSIIRRI